MPTDQKERTCMTCRHMGTHAECDGCLGDNGQPYDYAHWEEGDWMLELKEAQQAGECSIHCGGELDLWSHHPPRQVSDNWHHAAEECGYVVGHLTYVGDNKRYVRLHAITRDDEVMVVWKLREMEDDEEGSPIDKKAAVHRVYRRYSPKDAWERHFPVLTADADQAREEDPGQWT